MSQAQLGNFCRPTTTCVNDLVENKKRRADCAAPSLKALIRRRDQAEQIISSRALSS